jgi:DNA-binding NarL/FixJ family response regulator
MPSVSVLVVAAPDSLLAGHGFSGVIAVVGVVPDVRGALATVVVDLPDVVVIDRDVLPGVTALAAVWWMQRHAPSSRVALVAADDDITFETIVSGAFTVIAPNELGELDAALVAAARGESRLGPHAAARLVAAIPTSERRHEPFGTVRLTAVEHEILTRLAAGVSIETIAEDHDVSPRLVHLHIGYAVAKCQTHHAQQQARADVDADATYAGLASVADMDLGD